MVLLMVLELIVLPLHKQYLNVFFFHFAEFQVTLGGRTVKTFSQGNWRISEDQRKAVKDVIENKILFLSESSCNL